MHVRFIIPEDRFSIPYFVAQDPAYPGCEGVGFDRDDAQAQLRAAIADELDVDLAENPASPWDAGT